MGVRKIKAINNIIEILNHFYNPQNKMFTFLIQNVHF